jgi:hypothetical protein
MAQNGILSDRQNCGEPPALLRHDPVAHGIDPAMQSMESSTAQPGVDCIFPKTKLDQLSS